MAGLMDLLGSVLDQNTVKQMAGQLGAPEDKVQDAIGMALPALLQGLNCNAANPQGAEALASALQRNHDGSVLDNLGGFLNNFQQGPGAGILKHVLGGQQEVVQQGIGKASGLDAGAIANLLQMLAPLVMGSLGRATQAQGAGSGGGLGNLVNVLPGLLGSATTQVQQQQPQASNLVGMLLDQNKDGNVVDDVMRMLGGFLKR